MNNQNKKSQNQWKNPGWSIGSERPQKKIKSKPGYDKNGIKGYKNEPGKPGKKEQVDAGTDNKFNPFSNIGWLFYKDYYHGIDFQPGQPEDAFKTDFEKKNNAVTNRELSQYRDEVESLKLDFQNIQSFELTTEYPGLATGLGSPHGTGYKGEYKLGFHFDHTTGLPIIPGSSVKGVLRSAFQYSPDYIKYLLESLPEKETPMPRIDISVLEKEIFAGEGISPYKRDVFLDAVIVSSGDNDELFLADDFITPHPDEFKDPIPLQFLKVRSQVTFRFQFRLNCGLISVVDKKNLFKRILLDLGIGAKTNVGYGKFE
jgi:CRISPR-associated protein Cmr6